MNENAIEVHNLSKDYFISSRGENWRAVVRNIFKPEKTAVQAVKSLNFTIKNGEKVGFIGKNGAGKTTTIKMLTGSRKVVDFKPLYINVYTTLSRLSGAIFGSCLFAQIAFICLFISGSTPT